MQEHSRQKQLNTVGNGGYRWGYGGHEKLDEVNGVTGSTVDMGDRWLDTRIGRTSKRDRKAAKYPHLSPYCYAANNPIIFIDPDGEEVVWHARFLNHKNFKTLIDKISATDTYKTIFKRFIANQDNVFIKPATGSGYWGWAKSTRGAHGYDLELNFAESGGWLTVDPTFLAKIILHEGLHHRYNMAQDEGNEADYPTLHRHMNKERNPAETNPSGGMYHGDHEAMAEGNIETFVTGMKEFDKEYGSEHSDDWYNAMAYRGSVKAFTNAYQNLDATTKAKYQKIITNEQRYEAFLNANATYLQNKTAANKKAMQTAKSNVNWKLFKKTRTKTTP
jgi:RHS repeat-associated protein